jgi:hemolysin III
MSDKSPTRPRPLSRSEQIADRWVNGVAAFAGAIGVGILVAVAVPQRNATLTVSVLVYGGALLAMLICSALYNGGTSGRRKDFLRRLDHAAIFVLIAGTYTPFLTKMAGDWSRWLLVYVWTVAGIGAALKLIWRHRFDRLSVALYLFLGWTIVAAIEPLAAAASTATILQLAAGGILYTAGVIFHLWEKLRYQQSIWHGFVAAAAACHYAAVLFGVALPPATG